MNGDVLVRMVAGMLERQADQRRRAVEIAKRMARRGIARVTGPALTGPSDRSGARLTRAALSTMGVGDGRSALAMVRQAEREHKAMEELAGARSGVVSARPVIDELGARSEELARLTRRLDSGGRLAPGDEHFITGGHRRVHAALKTARTHYAAVTRLRRGAVGTLARLAGIRPGRSAARTGHPAQKEARLRIPVKPPLRVTRGEGQHAVRVLDTIGDPQDPGSLLVRTYATAKELERLGKRWDAAHRALADATARSAVLTNAAGRPIRGPQKPNAPAHGA